MAKKLDRMLTFDEIQDISIACMLSFSEFSPDNKCDFTK